MIGVLLEVIKRLQANSDLDAEYLDLATGGGDGGRMAQILQERAANAEVVSRLLSELDA